MYKTCTQCSLWLWISNREKTRSGAGAALPVKKMMMMMSGTQSPSPASKYWFFTATACSPRLQADAWLVGRTIDAKIMGFEPKQVLHAISEKLLTHKFSIFLLTYKGEIPFKSCQLVMTVARRQIVLFLSDLYEHVSAPVKGHCTGKSIIPSLLAIVVVAGDNIHHVT